MRAPTSKRWNAISRRNCSRWDFRTAQAVWTTFQSFRRGFFISSWNEWQLFLRDFKARSRPGRPRDVFCKRAREPSWLTRDTKRTIAHENRQFLCKCEITGDNWRPKDYVISLKRGDNEIIFAHEDEENHAEKKLIFIFIEDRNVLNVASVELQHNSDDTTGLHNITFVPLSAYHVPLYRFPFRIAR